MSATTAFAAVTTALHQVIADALPGTVEGAEVEISTERPDVIKNGDNKAKVNLFLYQVTPNPSWRNADLPTRRGDGTFSQRPQAAFDLHYLISFLGDAKKQVPELLLGSTVLALHVKPLIELMDQDERVRFTPEPLNLEELSRLWSVFFQVPYCLSIAYHGSVVLIDADVEPPEVKTVQKRQLYVAPFRNIDIDGVFSQEGDQEPIYADSVLVVRGRHLRGEVTKVLIDGAEVTPREVGDARITVELAPLSLTPSQHRLRITHPLSTETPHLSLESCVVAFVVRPQVVIP